MKIFGHGTHAEPGELLLNDTAARPIHGWNVYTLDTPLLVDSGDYWVGYEAIPKVSGHPAGVDAGSAVEGKGDWIYIATFTEGWEGIRTMGLSSNWNIHVILAPISTGLEEVELSLLPVEIYPNPAQNEVKIVVDGLNDDATATILDMQGKVVGKHTVFATTGKATVDVSTLTDGSYVVQVVSNGVSRVGRLIINR